MKATLILLMLVLATSPLWAEESLQEKTLRIENSFPKIEDQIGASHYLEKKNGLLQEPEGYIPGCRLEKDGSKYILFDLPHWSVARLIDLDKATYHFDYDQIAAEYTQTIPSNTPAPKECGSNHNQKDWSHKLIIQKGPHLIFTMESKITCISKADNSETIFETRRICDFRFQLRK